MPRQRRVGNWIAIIAAAVVSFAGGRILRVSSVGTAAKAGETEPSDSHGTPSLGKRPSAVRDFAIALQDGSSSQLAELFSVVTNVRKSAEMERVAARLLSDEAAASKESIWGIVLARWSSIDAPGMVAFVERQRKNGALVAIEEMAWSAWGAADPQAAFEAVRTRSKLARCAALRGMAQVAPEKVVELVWKMPDAQFCISSVVRDGRVPIERLDELRTRSVYDGSREPVERAKMATLAQSDPAAAIETAKSAGRVWRDPVAWSFGLVAREFPAEAKEHWEELPDSRARALAGVSIARTLASQNPDDAIRWARESLSEPVRDSALVEIAAVIGGQDPVAGLELIQEVGWGEVGRFYEIAESESGKVLKGQSHAHSTPIGVAQSLVRQLATSDPEAARAFIEGASDGVREELRRAAGLEKSEP